MSTPLLCVCFYPSLCFSLFFFFNDPATTEIYTLPYTTLFRSVLVVETGIGPERATTAATWLLSRPSLEQVPYRPKVVIAAGFADRKSTRLNSSHMSISYAVFCLKKKKTTHKN